jgi:hypothetical protein
MESTNERQQRLAHTQLIPPRVLSVAFRMSKPNNKICGSSLWLAVETYGHQLKQELKTLSLHPSFNPNPL